MQRLLLLLVASLALLTSALRRQDERRLQEGRPNPWKTLLSSFRRETAGAQVPPGPHLAGAVPPPPPTLKLWSWLGDMARATSGLLDFLPKGGLEFMPRAPWRYATYQNSSQQNWTNGSLALPPFKNVLLVVHCRVGAEKVTIGEKLGFDFVVCRDREEMARMYAPYFGDIFYMTQENHCKREPTDPTVCLAKLMETRGANRDGIFYMHFDAVIDPVKLAVGFKQSQVYSFIAPHPCTLDGDLSMVDCKWAVWQSLKSKWAKAWMGKGHELIEDLQTVWLGNDDVFYIPRGAYELYAKLARGFAEFHLHHEAAGPTIRAYITRQLKIIGNNLNCTGGPTARLTADVALRPDFKCGHKFDLRDKQLRRTLTTVIERR